jgi:signal transduction histidine kinase
LSIKGRIRAFQIMVALTLTGMAALALVNLQGSTHNLDRLQSAQRQLAAAAQLAIDANRFSEQIAELLLIGEPERPDFDSARAQLRQALDDLRQVTLEEDAVVGDREEEQVEVDRIDRMQALLGGIDRAVERLLLLNQQGRRDEAIALFRSEIENRLDAEFESLIAAAVADERAETLAVEADVARLAGWVTAATLAGVVALVAATLIAGFLFARSIARPIRSLAEGALAIERGDLGHRIGPLGHDELGLLAERFDAMAEQLEHQHAMLVGAQGELERQVAERTSELAEANRQLTATNQHRVRFLGDISHELRTPLTALRGEAEVALRGAQKEEGVYREALSTVIARAADMARLVEDLLFLARSETDEIRFDMRRLDPVDVVAEAVRDAAVLARERRVQVELSPQETPDPVLIRGDPRRLKQAVMITLDNAIKYSDPGARVEVGVGLAADDDGVAEIRIRDQGPGFAPEDIPRAFERFYRGAEARERWDGGSGLGLPIARWIVEKHEGRIDLSSVLGQGTEVRFRLPIAR